MYTFHDSSLIAFNPKNVASSYLKYYLFYDGGPYHTGTSSLICSV